MPNTATEYAVWEACQAFKQSRKAEDRDDTMSSYSISIDGRSIKNGYIYPNNTKAFLKKRYKESFKKVFTDCKIKTILNVKTTKVCKIIYKPGINKFYLSIPENQSRIPEPKREFIALDPGVRTFMTFYDGESFGEIGRGISNRLTKLNLQQDKLKSRLTKSKGYKKLKIKRAIAMCQRRKENIVNDLHYKTRNFLNQYKYVLLPSFNTSKMVRNDKLSTMTKRCMLDLAHFKFKLRLAALSSKNRKIIICNEACTSKTCTRCGSINSTLGSKKVYKCNECNLIIDRDFNGARNILLRALSTCNRSVN